MKKKNAVVKKESQSLATINFSADAGKGVENANKDCLAIPFLSVLQGLSPQIETVDGAKPGKIINTITNELFDEVLIVPCSFQRKFLRFVPRDQGGGYKGDYDPIDVDTGNVEGLERSDDGRLTIGGDDLLDTRNHFILVQTKSGSWSEALLSLNSTQIKKSKRFMSLIKGIELTDEKGKKFNPASFSHVYKLTTIKEENSKGSWYGVQIELFGTVDSPEVYEKAKDFHASVTTGKVEVQHPEIENKF